MTNLRESVSRRGTRSYTFDFGDGNQTILVRSFEKPPCRSGAGTVEGTFEKAKQGGHFSNLVTARSVTCLSVQRRSGASDDATASSFDDRSAVPARLGPRGARRAR